MQTRMLNCAVVGLGIGAQHATTLLAHPQTILTDIVEIDPQKKLEFIQQHPEHTIRDRDFDSVVTDPNTHLITIASFDDAHYAAVMACFKNSKHVFVEKPMCQNRSQLETLYEMWKKNPIGLYSNLLLRKAPLFMWLKKMITEGEFGEIFALEGDYLYGRLEKITHGWRSKVNHYSVMAGGGIHLIDIMLWLTDQYPTHVHAYANKIATQNTAFRYPDFHSANFHFASGLHAKITANFACVHPHQHVLKIFGTRCSFIYDDQGARLFKSRDEHLQAHKINFASRPEHKGILLPEFIEHIFANETSHLAQKEFDLMCIVLATDQALSHHEPLKIEYLTC